jgi:hypothetical protein
VFLVGCSNSGTSLLHDLFAAHPEVASLPREGQSCTDQLPRPWDFGIPRLWTARPDLFRLGADAKPAIDVDRMLRQWGAHLIGAGRPVVVEKTPTNAARIPWLRRTFPNSAIVAIVRDGRAVAEGIRRKSGQSVEFGALQWRRCNEVMLGDMEGLERTATVRYEELAADPLGTVRRVFDVAGLDASGVEAAPDGVRVAGRPFLVGNQNAASLARLSEADHALVRSVAGELLDRLGYR